MENQQPQRPKALLPSGGYEKLVSYQVTKLLHAVTVRFVDRYIPQGSRTHDQMEQAARSGERNIGEGSKISATTRKLELNLTNVARASVDELRKDYEAFLAQRKLPLWEPMDPRRKELSNARCKDADEVARWIKALWEREKEARMAAPPGPRTARTPTTVQGRAYAEISANVGQTLCKIAIHLLDKQVDSQARKFEAEGGFSERLYQVRREAKRQQGAGGR
ncbi:MAG: four helix bundle suffix domain-containing protein [Flavobacteriales bacterium]|jgi:four helix bundle suffix protein|nr:four helix bundle suffix domain-containing protein [Flavobacteriales bacterium]